ncbi:MAG TPA: hypothetical protein VME21_05375 [Steroidobacteraceae bacterium]|nr:hypothetical protein [Steroidobacteraceae bacterium]
MCRLRALRSSTLLLLGLAAGIGATVPSPASAQNGQGAADASARDAAPQPAHWVEKKIRFTYQGFTTHYSCEGLRDQVASVLRQLGARADMQVHELGCTAALGRPEPFPMVSATFYVLEPGPAAQGPSVPAHWAPLRLQLSREPLGQSGQCELIEQVKHDILPLFSTHNVEFSDTCIPYQLVPGGTRLSAEVLVPNGQHRADVSIPPG